MDSNGFPVVFWLEDQAKKEAKDGEGARYKCEEQRLNDEVPEQHGGSPFSFIHSDLRRNVSVYLQYKEH